MLNSGLREVLIFRGRSGVSPFSKWIDSLDWKTQERIFSRVARMKRGQFGDHKSLSDGVFELRLFFGPGYRVYFGEHRRKIVLLLTGGDKSTQTKDIRQARELWKEYLEDNP